MSTNDSVKYLVEETFKTSPTSSKEYREVRVYEAVWNPKGYHDRGRMVQQQLWVNGNLEETCIVEDISWDEFCRRYKDNPKYKPLP